MKRRKDSIDALMPEPRLNESRLLISVNPRFPFCDFCAFLQLRLLALLAAKFAMAKAIGGVIVDHADGLHKGVADGGADEFEAALFHVLAHRVGLLGLRGYFLHRSPTILHRLPLHELPEISIEAAALFDHRDRRLRVGHCGVDFQTIADDARIEHELLDFLGAIARDLFVVETVERFAIVLALAQDDLPAQASLGPIENQLLKQMCITVRRRAPLVIVVVNGKV